MSAEEPAVLVPLVREFSGAVLECVHDQNGNHVVQKCIEVMSKERLRLKTGNNDRAAVATAAAGGVAAAGGDESPSSLAPTTAEDGNIVTTTSTTATATLSEHVQFIIDAFQGQV